MKLNADQQTIANELLDFIRKHNLNDQVKDKNNMLEIYFRDDIFTDEMVRKIRNNFKLGNVDSNKNIAYVISTLKKLGYKSYYYRYFSDDNMIVADDFIYHTLGDISIFKVYI